MGTDSTVPLIPRAVLYGNPEKTGPQLAPDGKTLAYIAPLEGVLNIWLRTPGQEDDRALTQDKKRGIRSYFWRPDSLHILYIQDQDGDENWHLYQTDIHTGETRDLTPYPNVRATIVSVHPDFPDAILIGLNLRDPRFTDVHRVNLITGEVTLDTENPGDVTGWEEDNTFQIRVAQAMRPDGGTEIRLRAHPGAPWQTFQSWGPDESFGGVLGFTPDDNSLWLLSSVDANAARLLEVRVADGQTRVIAEDLEYDVTTILRHPRKRTLEAVAFLRARLEWVPLTPDLEADFAFLRTVCDGDFSVANRTLDNNLWLVFYNREKGSPHYYTYDRAAKKATFLFAVQPAVDNYPLASMQPISYTARDGLKLQGYLTLPPGVESKNLPLILLVHGGPWARDVWSFNPEVQLLANRGYAVLQINFRGSTGYGKAHLNAGEREWAGRMHDDLLDGKAWAIAQGIADSARVAIMGGSYGGYATLVGLTFTPEEFACGVDIVGPSNLLTLMQSIPPYWTPMLALFMRHIGNPETESEFMKSRSPLFRADRITKPLLIAQGANDPRVKQAESDQIVEAMRKNGQPVEYLLFPDEGHGFARPENRLIFMAAAEAFLAKYLGGRAEPPSEAELPGDIHR
ncbi:MAG TPA: S9 family peptidase [Chthonomonadaceae bacterium]|nr:S9 family peptidase [Chthonomonadaceae bacterium]